MVEFAFAMGIFFSLFLGFITFSQALYAYDLVTGAARIGTRYAIVHGSSCTLSICPVTAAEIQTYVRSQVDGIVTSNLTVTTTWPGGANCPTSPYQAPLCIVKVYVSYPFQLILFTFTKTLTITNTSQMIISQ
jgi:Flp pilus assembly protein TadG